MTAELEYGDAFHPSRILGRPPGWTWPLGDGEVHTVDGWLVGLFAAVRLDIGGVPDEPTTYWDPRGHLSYGEAQGPSTKSLDGIRAVLAKASEGGGQKARACTTKTGCPLGYVDENGITVGPLVALRDGKVLATVDVARLAAVERMTVVDDWLVTGPREQVVGVGPDGSPVVILMPVNLDADADAEWIARVEGRAMTAPECPDDAYRVEDVEGDGYWSTPGSRLVRVSDGVVIFSDRGMQPEDATLRRDLDVLVDELNRIARSER